MLDISFACQASCLGAVSAIWVGHATSVLSQHTPQKRCCYGSIQMNFSSSDCRLQFDTTLKKAVEFAESIDKNGPDTPTDMQARFLLSLLYLLHSTPSSPSFICMHLCIV